MSEKRTEQIAVRITSETKQILQKEAEKLDWSTAKLVEKILSEWTKSSDKNGGSVSFIIHDKTNISVC